MSEDYDGKLGNGEYDGRDSLSTDETRCYQDGIERRGGATDTSWGGRGKVLTHPHTYTVYAHLSFQLVVIACFSCDTMRHFVVLVKCFLLLTNVWLKKKNKLLWAKLGIEPVIPVFQAGALPMLAHLPGRLESPVQSPALCKSTCGFLNHMEWTERANRVLHKCVRDHTLSFNNTRHVRKVIRCHCNSDTKVFSTRNL